MTGKVLKFDSIRGFGFIQADEAGGRDIFVHYKQIVDEGTRFKNLDAGDAVVFDLVESAKGLRAANVRVLRRAE
jgi:CspA family cold shock protein